MKILLADDHDLIREGIKLVLNNYTQNVELIEASNYPDTLKYVKDNFDLDLIIVDLFMPGASGTQGIKILRESAPCVPIIVLSSSEETEHIKSALEYGANGYIPKSSSNDILFRAIKLVMAGGIYLPPEMLINSNTKKKPLDTIHLLLTERQIEVLELMAKGNSNKEIARIMDITDHTVKSHVSMIFSHLNAKNRTQAVLNAQQSGLVSS